MPGLQSTGRHRDRPDGNLSLTNLNKKTRTILCEFLFVFSLIYQPKMYYGRYQNNEKDEDCQNDQAVGAAQRKNLSSILANPIDPIWITQGE